MVVLGVGVTIFTKEATFVLIGVKFIVFTAGSTSTFTDQRSVPPHMVCSTSPSSSSSFSLELFCALARLVESSSSNRLKLNTSLFFRVKKINVDFVSIFKGFNG